MMTSEQIRDLAAQLYVKYLVAQMTCEPGSFLDGADPEDIAKAALDEAEAFAKVTASRKESPAP